jgi:hypothetical protein
MTLVICMIYGYFEMLNTFYLIVDVHSLILLKASSFMKTLFTRGPPYDCKYLPAVHSLRMKFGLLVIMIAMKITSVRFYFLPL